MGSAGVKSWTATMVEHRAPAMVAGEYEEVDEEEEDINMVKTQKKKTTKTKHQQCSKRGQALACSYYCMGSSRKQCDFILHITE
jgi:hypothetical protein